MRDWSVSGRARGGVTDFLGLLRTQSKDSSMEGESGVSGLLGTMHTPHTEAGTVEEWSMSLWPR